MNRFLSAAGIAGVIAGLSLGAAAALGDDGSAGVIAYKGKVLLDTSVDTLGKAVAYPAGAAHITAQVVTLKPGTTSNPNVHQTPMYLQVLEGDFTVDYGAQGKKTYHAGEAFIEAQGVPHHGVNEGSTPVTFLAIYMGAEGIANETAP